MNAPTADESERSILAGVATVLIGRNEAPRLRAAIGSGPAGIGAATSLMQRFLTLF
jgi:hypothetical protein